MTVTVLTGDCREVLRSLPDDSVHCVVTSPPYWGLRDYGIGSDAFGLEPTYQLYIEHAMEVFREVRRALRQDGTLWLNLGDSYSGYHGNRNSEVPTSATNGWTNGTNENLRGSAINSGLKPKDLCGIPWRVAFALQADGWWLRQDIIWSKPNPMPESVTDRCTKSHEYLFLLSKSGRYYYDAEAIAENRASVGGDRVNGWATGDTPHTPIAHSRDKGDARSFRGGGKYTNNREQSPNSVERETCGNGPALSEKRNKRSVWEIATAPFSEAHFATFPPALIEPCILAGCSRGGTVLDPFGGAGTTGLVADRLERNAILIELNSEYADMAERRIRDDAGMFAQVVTS